MQPQINIPDSYKSTAFTELVKMIELIMETKEFRNLQYSVELNEAHDNITVLNHTMRVISRIQELLRLSLFNTTLQDHASSYFAASIGRFTRAELFLLSAVVHDIGKPDTLVLSSNGFTSAPGHERVGEKISRSIFQEVGLQEKEAEYVLTLVRIHSGYSLRVLAYLMSLSDEKLHEAVHRSLFVPEVLIFMLADNESAKSFAPYRDFILNRFLHVPVIYALNNENRRGDTSINDSLEQILGNLRTYSNPWTVEIRLLHLSEEVGELHDIYLQNIGAKERVQTLQDIAHALSDILVELIGIYDILGLSIIDEIRKVSANDEA